MAKSFGPIHPHDEVVSVPKRRGAASSTKTKPSKTSGGAKAKGGPKAPGGPKGQRPSAAAIGFLTIWHGVFSGGFFVAMLTGNGLYDAHVFSGVLVLFAIGARLLVGMMFPAGHVLVFPFPSFVTLTKGTAGFRRFVSHVMGLAMLMACGLAVLTGWYSNMDNLTVHSAVAYMTLSLIGGHIVLVIVWQGWKKVESKFSARG